MNSQHRVAAIEAGGTKWRVSVGVSLDHARAVTIRTEDPTTTLEAVAAFIKEDIRAHGPIRALGIGSFGPLGVKPHAADYGVMGRTPKTGWQGVNLASYFRSLAVPVVIDTDVNAAAKGEFDAWGEPSGRLVYITVGTGIGGGVIDSGVVSLGTDHAEMGHISARRHIGDLFEGVCPYHGDCVEGLASGPAIEARWGVNLSALDGQHPAHEIISDYLGQLCANLLLTLTPHQLVIGGGVLETPGLLHTVRRATHNLLNGYLARFEQLSALEQVIRAPRLGSDAGLAGAFSMAQGAVTTSD